MKYFTKKAVGPVVYKMTDADRLINPNLAGKYVSPEALTVESVKALNLPKRALKKGLIIKTPESAYIDGPVLTAQQGARIINRHELTHYLRDNAGHFKNVGEPGFKGVGATLREEYIASNASLKRISLSKTKKIKANVVTAIDSTKYAYPQGLLKALLKIK